MQDDGRTGNDSNSLLGFIVVEHGHYRPVERRRFITEVMPITNGSYFPVIYIDHLSSIGKIITEDGALLTNEDGKTYVRVERPYYMATTRDREYEFNLYENAGYNLVLEDGSHLIVEGDETAQKLSRIQTEEGHVKTWGGEVEFDLVESMAYHMMMENDDHHIYEDETRAVTEEDHVKTFAGEIEFENQLATGQHTLMEDGYHYLYEDESLPQLEEGYLKSFFGDINTNLVDTNAWHLMMENDDHHIYEDKTRALTEEDHVKTPDHFITIDMHGEVLALEDGSGYFITEGATPNRILVAPTVPGIKSGQSCYMFPSQLSGSVAIAHNGTTVTGTGTSFTTELSTDDVFQTSDENILLEEGSGGNIELLLEDDERLTHEDIIISEVQEAPISYHSGIQIRDFRWMIASEDSNLDPFAIFGPDAPNVLGSYDINTTDESFFMLGEDSNSGNILALEDDSGQFIMETSDAISEDLLLESEDKILLTEPGEFRISSISNDTSLVVTRKHWGGTDAVPFWKQTTETEVTAAVSYL
jgi:rubrerythrin